MSFESVGSVIACPILIKPALIGAMADQEHKALLAVMDEGEEM